MSNYVRTYKFLGTGTLWDSEENKVLCRFDKNGEFETADPEIIRKLVKMRVPYDDGQAEALANAEYAIDLLSERVNILEKMNEELQWKLELYEKKKVIDDAPSRAALLAELDYYGIPYVQTAKDKTLELLLEEYKQLMQIKSEEALGSTRVD